MSQNPVVNPRIYYGFVGVTGGAIMMLEFAASRMLAPWFGTSTFVWGNIIGVVLIALSLGYYFGGRLADKQPQSFRLANIVLVAGIFSSCIPLLAALFLNTVNLALAPANSAVVYAMVGSFVMVVVLFAIPIFLLGMVSPYAIRLATTSIEDAGKVAGGIYAWSTVGSIFGTFGSAFFLVPYIGSRETILLSALLLIIAAVALRRKPMWLYAVVLVPIALYLVLSTQPVKADENIIEQRESVYQYLQVIDLGDKLGLVVNEGLGTQSYYMKEGILTGAYFDYAAITPVVADLPDDASMLALGVAGGTITRQLNHYFPNMKKTGVEIDGEIVELANKYFDLEEQNMKMVVADGRTYLRNSKDTYDFIMMDTFSHDLYIPWHLTTQEYFTEVNDHLTDGGILVINIGSVSGETKLLQAITTTVQSVFPEVAIMRVPGHFNYVLMASQQPLQFDKLTDITDERADIAATMYVNYYYPEPTDIPVLTDNRAPIELYSEAMVVEYLQTQF